MILINPIDKPSSLIEDEASFPQKEKEVFERILKQNEPGQTRLFIIILCQLLLKNCQILRIYINITGIYFPVKGEYLFQ